MTAFWIVAALMTGAALAALLWPLLRTPRGLDAAARASFDLTVYKDQLAEVDRDLERGVLSEDQAEAARVEIERRMLAVAAEQEQAVQAPSPRLTRVLAAVIVAAVPLSAFGLYAALGEPGLDDQPLASRAAPASQTAEGPTVEQVDALINDLKAQLAAEPNNMRYLTILARAYEMRGNLDGAAEAYAKLLDLTDRHPEVLISLGETLFLQAGEVVTPDATALFAEAKAKDPGNPMAYYYLALGHQQADELQAAMDEYVGLLKVSSADAPWVTQIQARMQNLAAEMGVEVPVVEMLPPQNAVPGPTADQVREAQDMSTEDQQAMIRSMVERLAARLQDNPDDLAGWQRLAQAYRVLGEDAKLAEAEAQIKRLLGN